MVTKSYIGKISLNFTSLFIVFLYIRRLVYTLGINVYESISNMETATYIIVQLLLILSGDIELNPGPTNLREHSVSFLHCNMRSIRNKLEHIIDNFCDFDCLSFTETHLDDNIDNAEIFLTTDFSAPYRKDRTNHGGGILDFVNECIPHKDVTIRPYDKPWYDSEIRKYSRKRDRQKSKATKSGLQTDWTKYKLLRNKVNNLKKHAKETFYNNLELSLLSNFSNNKKEFWKIVKHFTSKNDTVSSIPPLSTTNTSGTHILHVTDEEKANCLNNYFAAISTLDDSNADLPPFYAL